MSARHTERVTYREPQTMEQALVEAFYLELIAPDKGKAQAAAILAAHFATDLDGPTISMCRAAARERYEAEESNGII